MITKMMDGNLQIVKSEAKPIRKKTNKAIIYHAESHGVNFPFC
jgi:hypothetical protein